MRQVGTPITMTYRTVDSLALQADIYPGRGDGMRPALLWLHGGALIFGDRAMLRPEQRDLYVNAGYTVIAVDYRLAPETKLPEIASDIAGAIAWVRAEGARHVPIDPHRLAIVGHSAGGYLTLLAGGRVYPRPQALIAFYGYGDIIGAWYTTPSPFYCQFPLVSAHDAWLTVAPETQARQPPIDVSTQPPPDRRMFYLFCRQQGTWPQEVAGLDPGRDRQALQGFCPVRHVSTDYPPTLLLHGDADSDVPYEQSQLMASALAAAGVPHQLLAITDGEHGFDACGDDPEVRAAFANVLAFLAEHV